MVDTNTPNDIVSRNVATYRKWRGLSQDELAERLEVFTGTKPNRRTIRRLEGGGKQLTVNDLFMLALCLETTVEKLISPVDRGYQAEHRMTQPEFVEFGTSLVETVPAQTAEAVLSDGDDDLLHVPPVGLDWSDVDDPQWRIPIQHARDDIVTPGLIHMVRTFYGHDVPDDIQLEDIILLIRDLEEETLSSGGSE